MAFDLAAPFAADSSTNEEDVRALKILLNRLGYYAPYEETGISAISDRELFSALEQFQKDQGLPVTGKIKPGDETVQALGAAQKKQESSETSYVWRTVGDDKVRPGHASRTGKTFQWNKPPEGGHPGEDYNCRCWTESAKQQATGLTQEVISPINDAAKRWTTEDFKNHFYKNNGASVTLSEMGLLKAVIEHAQQIMFKNVEEQVAHQATETGTGNLNYTTENSYEFQSIAFSLGNSVIKTKTEGTVTQKDHVLQIDAKVYYQLEDEFTDPANLREYIVRTSSSRHPAFEKMKWTELGGTIYSITDSWITKLTGTINAKE